MLKPFCNRYKSALTIENLTKPSSNKENQIDSSLRKLL